MLVELVCIRFAQMIGRADWWNVRHELTPREVKIYARLVDQQ